MSISLNLILTSCLALAFAFTAGGCPFTGQIGVRSREEVNAGSKSKRATARLPRSAPSVITVSTNPPASCQLTVTAKSQTGRQFRYDLSGVAKARLIPGKYLFDARCQEYEAVSVTVELPHDAPGGSIVIPLVPVRTETILKTIPAAAEVSLDGHSLGVSGPDGVLRLPALKPGLYQLFVGKQGYKSRLTEVEVHSSLKTLTIELTKDEVIGRYESLTVAINRGELDQALDLYETLAGAEIDRSLLAGAMSRLLYELDRRSLQLLQKVGPYGLVLSRSEVEAMRRLYHRAQPLAAKTIFEVDRSFTVRAAFWELRWAINEQSGQLAGEALGKDPKVKAALERFTALAPFDGFLWYDLGALYVNLRYPRDAAKRAFENARDARPEWAYPYFGLAIIETEQSYALKNKTELRAGLQSAGAKFEEAIKRDGDFVLAYIIGALCYADAAQTPKAIILAQQAASKAPNSGLAKYALGYAYFGSGRKQYPNARAFLQEALSAKSDPLDAGQVNHAQEILKEIGRKH